jgi:Tfp pilus assembly protein PilN
MPSINMIATRRSEKKRFERNMRRLMAVVLAEVVVGLVLGGWFTARIIGTRDRINNMDVQLQKLRPTVKKIEDYEAETGKMRPKLELLETAKGRTLRWYNMLAEMSSVLPSQTWITKLESVDPGVQQGQPSENGASTVNITGVAPNHNQVGDTMLRLNSYPDFEKVDLTYTSTEMVGKQQATGFSISIAMKKDEKPKEGATDANAKS